MSPRLRGGLVALTVALAAGALLLTVPRGAPVFVVGREVAVGLLFALAGLLAWAKRPESTVGRLMTIAGLVWLLARVVVWSGGNSLVFTVGLVLVLLPIALVAHLAVVFPGGRPGSRWERSVVVSSYAVILGGVPFLDLGECSDCPRNLLAISAEAGGGRVLEVVSVLSTLVVIAAFVTVLVRHWWRGSVAARRVLAPVLPPALLYAAVQVALLLEQLGAPIRLGDLGGVLEEAAIFAIPLAFLAGLLRSRLVRASVGRLIVDLGGGEADDTLEAAVAKALGDPSLRLASWSPEAGEWGEWKDADGQPMTLPAGDDRTAVTVIERTGRRIGALVHDPALREEPALLDAVCAAAGLAMDNQRLHAEVVARLEEVRASRARIVEAGDAERRRVERNLHDGAQQRLITSSLALTMARNHLGPQPDSRLQAMLEEAASELQGALGDLRELARGIHPSILTEAGLVAALETLAERSPVPVEVCASAHGRLPAAVEAAAYYVVSEALTNAVKYSRASFVTVRVGHNASRLTVEVADDGVGGATLRSGSGLEGLADRVAALDGRLTVDSPPGGGTRVGAEIPCG